MADEEKLTVGSWQLADEEKLTVGSWQLSVSLIVDGQN